MLNNNWKIPAEIIVPSVGIILSIFVLVARAAWTDTVTPTATISAEDWNQMAIVLAGLDDKATRLESILPGLLCGRTIRGSSYEVRHCFGHDPRASCPGGFTRVGGVIGTDNRSVWTCVKNP